MVKTTNPLYCWDFTLKYEDKSETEITNFLRTMCKSGKYQHECGVETNYHHYQGRIKLITKVRINTLQQLSSNKEHILSGAHWSPTSNFNKNNFDYVSKEHTKIGDTIDILQKPAYIPRQVREMKCLRPFQQQIIDDANVWDTRTINYVFNKRGNVGKSRLCSYLRAHKLGRPLPPCNNYRDLMAIVCDVPTSNLYLIDLPKAMRKHSLNEMFTAIESIKDGFAFDTRYKYKEKIFDCPNIWVFGNIQLNINYLTEDRWKFWKVTEEFSLIRYTPEICDISDSDSD